MESGYLWLPLAGFLIAMFATMTGGGGGFFFVPLMVLVYAVPAQVAVATSLAVTIPIALIGSVEHMRRGHVSLRLGLMYGLSGVGGALVGAYLSNLMSPDLLGRVFGIYGVLLSVMMLTTGKRREKSEVNPPQNKGFLTVRSLPNVFFGIISGLIAGLFGTSGSAPALAGMYIMKTPLKVTIGTAGLVVLFNSVSGLSGHMLIGSVDLRMTILLACGAIVGAFIGPRLVSRIKHERTEKIFRVLLIFIVFIVGIIMIFK